MADRKRKTYAVTSAGLWRIRDDISRLLDAEIVAWPLGRVGRIDGFVGWGWRPSGLKAKALSTRARKPCMILEDGFIKGYAPGAGEPGHSFVVDDEGIYFDAGGPSRLQRLLDEPASGVGALDRARDLIGSIRRAQLSKYNNGPMIGLREAGVPYGRPYVLLVDQVAGDASIAGALAGDDAFVRMMEHAVAHHPGKTIVVRTHPAAGDRSLLRQAAQCLGVDIVVPAPMNPWPLLEEADAVYTVSSQLGFEALMAEKPVHCFGVAFFSGRGLTQDHLPVPVPRKTASVEQVFDAAYISYSRYLDLHDRSDCVVERAIEQAIAVRDQRCRLPKRVVTAGLSPWKRRALAPFLKGREGRSCMRVALASQRAGPARSAAAWLSGVRTGRCRRASRPSASRTASSGPRGSASRW